MFRPILSLSHTGVVFLLLIAFISFDVSAQEYKTFNARNRVTIEYTLLLPDGYDAANDYPTAVAFAGPAAWEKEANQMIQSVWSKTGYQNEWIVLVPLTPGEDWRTHPNHHALNDLMNHVKNEFSVKENTFHILGIGQDGVDIASTWAGMSDEYFSSLTAVDGTPFRSWDDGDFKSFAAKDGRSQKYLVIESQNGPDLGDGLENFYEQLKSADHTFFQAGKLDQEALESGKVTALMSEFLLR